MTFNPAKAAEQTKLEHEAKLRLLYTARAWVNGEIRFLEQLLGVGNGKQA